MMDNKRRSILAIDDDITALTAIRTVLEGTFDVSLAKNADMAKNILHSAEIDMILLDLEMPGLPGMEFLSAIRNNTSFYHIPVIVVSSHGMADIIVKARKAGANDFVVKPIAPKALLEKIHSVLKVSRKKINRETLVRKLSMLETCCVMGQGRRADDLIDELEMMFCDMAVDLEVAEICKHTRAAQYPQVIQEIKQLTSKLAAS